MADRIRLSRKKGWRLPTGAVKVDRTTVYGNPFKAGEPNGLGWGTVRDTEHAVWLYRHWLTTPSRSIVFERDRHDRILRALPKLTGRDLACWCTAGGACHADVLLELANRPALDLYVELMLSTSLPLTQDEAMTAVGQLATTRGIDPADQDAMAGVVLRVTTAGRTGIAPHPDGETR